MRCRNEHERFLEKMYDTGSCWEWLGATYRGGYGHFRRKLDGKWVMHKAHRYAYEYYNGEIPKDHLVLHTCDNPKCVNPEHLKTGTHKENTQDMMRKGRFGYPRNPLHQLLDYETVLEIRQCKKDYPEMKSVHIASFFGISTPQASRILNNKTWVLPTQEN